MLTQEHAQTALDFLEKANKQYADGDQAQASATLWEAAAHAVMAVASERGWPHVNQTELRQAAGRLADEQNNSGSPLDSQSRKSTCMTPDICSWKTKNGLWTAPKSTTLWRGRWPCGAVGKMGLQP